MVSLLKVYLDWTGNAMGKAVVLELKKNLPLLKMPNTQCVMQKRRLTSYMRGVLQFWEALARRF